MFSNKMDFSSCVIWIDFYKSGHILAYHIVGKFDGGLSLTNLRMMILASN